MRSIGSNLKKSECGTQGSSSIGLWEGQFLGLFQISFNGSIGVFAGTYRAAASVPSAALNC